MTLKINENKALNAEYFLYVDIRESAVKFAIFDLQFAIENQVLYNSRDVVARDYEESGSSRERVKDRKSAIAIRKFFVPLVIIAQWHHPFPFRTRK